MTCGDPISAEDIYFDRLNDPVKFSNKIETLSVSTANILITPVFNTDFSFYRNSNYNILVKL